MRLVALSILSLASPVAASDFSLGFPVDCTLGQDCYVQNYVDRDSSEGYGDFMCNRLSYNGHKGTDIALHSFADIARNVAVLAAADGIVKGTRNSMPDRDLSQPGRGDIAGRECGNGLVVDHGDGWVTQYCHMKQGSVTVASGDVVTKGQVIGHIGASGFTDFPHLHMSLRKDDRIVDPFDPGMNAACGSQDLALWDFDFPYSGGGLIGTALQGSVPEYVDVKASQQRPDTETPQAPALLLWTFGYGLQPGDLLEMTIQGPSGNLLEDRITADRHRAQFFYYRGLRRPENGWPKGSYTGRTRHLRGNDLLADQSFDLTVQ